MSALVHNFSYHLEFHCVVHYTHNITCTCMDTGLLHTMRIRELAVFKPEFVALSLHFKQEVLNIIIMSLTWKTKDFIDQ